MIAFTITEKIVFACLLLLTTYWVARTIRQFSEIIQRGKNTLGKFSFTGLLRVLWQKVILLLPTWKTRFWPNLFHLVIVWGFIFFLLTNLIDLLSVFFGEISSRANSAHAYPFVSDIISGLILVSIIFFMVRRLSKPNPFRFRDNVLSTPVVDQAILADSLIVGGLITIHVGSHLVAESIRTQFMPQSFWLPFASLLSPLWAQTSNPLLLWKVFFWISILSLLVFIPYFPKSKHIHLIFAPLNFLFRSQQTSFSSLPDLNLDDPQVEIFGALRLEDLERSAILDSFACIMCFRCQDVCPPYQSGSPLSPAVFEINKRFYLKENAKQFSSSNYDSPALTSYAISSQAVWDCTTCGACVEICPVGIDPMADILAIRRGLTLMENEFPKSFQLLFRNIERTANPWGLSNQQRLDWAKGLHVTTIQENPHPDVLWWVGCAGAFENNAQKASRSFLKILNATQLNYAVLGEQENCTGDSVRRAGREDLYLELALKNIELLNQFKAGQIVTSCPHCLHNLKNEYSSLGADFSVVHSSQFLLDLVQGGSIQLTKSADQTKISYHDSCYLSRFNQLTDPAKILLNQCGQLPTNLQYTNSHTYCCGAGGAQYWKESTVLTRPVNMERWQQLTAEPVSQVVTACPFCLTMLADAGRIQDSVIPVIDLCEIILNQMQVGEK